LHAPIYQNLEYQAWKAKATDTEIKEGSTNNLPSIAFGNTAASEEVWKRDTLRRNASDSKVNTPKFLREIRGYLSSDSDIYVRSKFQPFDSSFNKSLEDDSIDLPKTIELPCDSFTSYIDERKEPPRKFSLPKKEPIPPAPGMHPYGYYQAPGIQYTPFNMYSQTAGQAYVPIYFPVIMQPQLYPTYNTEPLRGDTLTGRIKFFDNIQNYGFFVLDCDGTDLFVHYDDFLKSGITKDHIQMAKTMNMRFVFKRISYYGKYNLSNKAVDIQVLQGE